jgi:hypothetical protein
MEEIDQQIYNILNNQYQDIDRRIRRVVSFIKKLNIDSITEKFIDYLEMNNYNIDLIYPLYIKLYKNNNINGIHKLYIYYDKKNDSNMKIKYMNIGWYKLKDLNSLCNLVKFYLYAGDNEKCDKYCNILMSNNIAMGQFLSGIICKERNQYNKMIEHFTLFFSYISINDLGDEYDEKNMYSHAYGIITCIFTQNEIELNFIQKMHYRFEMNKDPYIGNLQLKINKTKLPNYRKDGECPICMKENSSLKIFDCLAHYYCDECTVQINNKCPICRLSRMCYH